MKKTFSKLLLFTLCMVLFGTTGFAADYTTVTLGTGEGIATGITRVIPTATNVTDVIVVVPVGYTLTGQTQGLTAYTNLKRLIIQGDGSNPVLNTKQFNFAGGAMTCFKFQNIQLLGVSDGSTPANYISSQSVSLAIDTVSFVNCSVRNFAGIFRMYSGNNFKNIVINKSELRNINNYNLINGASGSAFSSITAINSTFYGFHQSLFACAAATMTNASLSFDHCTFDEIMGNVTGKYFMDFGANTGCTLSVTNCIFGRIGGTVVNFGAITGTSSPAPVVTSSGNYATTDWTNNVKANTTTAFNITTTAYSGTVTGLFVTPTAYTAGTNSTAGNYTINDITFTAKATSGPTQFYYPVSVPLSVTSLSGFGYNVGSATSLSQSFTLSAVALRGAVTLTAPTDYEISSDNATFSGALSVGTAGSDVSSTTLYVRLKSGLGFATYNNELITVATAGLANQTITCSGTVLSGRTVLGTPGGVNTTNITTGGFTASWTTVPNASGYTVNVYQGTSTITTVSGISGTTTDISGLTSGNTYSYKVLAIGDGTSYDNSPESSATTVRLSGSYATDLFKTKTSGNWVDASTWQSSPDGGTTWNDATLTPDANAASVSVSNDVTYAGTPAIIGNTTVNSGATFINTTIAVAVATGKTLTIATGATLDNQLDNSSFSAGTGSAQVNGTFKISSYTGTSQLAFTNITFASGSTLYIGCPGAPRLAATNAGNVVWASTAGGSLLNSNPTTIAGNFTITNALGSALNHGTGNTVRTLTIGGNLTINGGAYNPQGGSGTGTQALTVNGNVYLSGAGKLYAVNPTVTGLGTISVGGNIYIQSPTDVALGAGVSSGVFSLAGVSQQTVTSDASTGYAIGDMTLNNNTGLSLGSDLTINGALNLTSGKVTLGAKNLTVGSVAGATSSNYIITDGTGVLNQVVADGSTKLFPVGASAASYDPASVTPVTGTTFGVRAYATLSGSAPDGIGYNAKEWDITPAVASSTQIALTPSNLVVSVSSPVIGHYVNGSYVNNSNVTVSNGTFTGTFATFSPFVTGGNTVATTLQEGISNATRALAFNNQLMVKGTVINDLITVYGINGQVVAKVKAAGEQTTLNLNRGIYLVNVKSSNSSTNFKVVIN